MKMIKSENFVIFCYYTNNLFITKLNHTYTWWFYGISDYGCDYIWVAILLVKFII